MPTFSDVLLVVFGVPLAIVLWIFAMAMLATVIRALRN